MKDILRVLVPTDFSKESQFALDWAQTVTRNKPGATVYILHVLPLTEGASHLGMGSVGYRMELQAIKEKMETFQSKLPGDLICFALYEKGRIADTVARVCREKDIDLAIMTTRGRHDLTHILAGSTTEETIRKTPCPVLVLHLNEKTKGELRYEHVHSA